MAKSVTAYTPDITKPDLELAGVGAKNHSALNGYESNGTPLN